MHGSYTSFILSPSKPLLIIRHFSFVCLVLVFFLCHYFDSNNKGKATQLYGTLSVLWAGAAVQPRGKSICQGLVFVVTSRKTKIQERVHFLHY